MQIIGKLVGLACFICFILVLIKQFKSGGVVHGIVGIITCGLWTFIWGWLNSTKLNIRNIMLVWSLLAIAGVVINVMFGGVYAWAPAPTTTP